MPLREETEDAVRFTRSGRVDHGRQLRGSLIVFLPFVSDPAGGGGLAFVALQSAPDGVNSRNTHNSKAERMPSAPSQGDSRLAAPVRHRRSATRATNDS